MRRRLGRTIGEAARLAVWATAAFFFLKVAHVTWAHARSVSGIDFYVFWDAASNVLNGKAWVAYAQHITPVGTLAPLAYPPAFLLLVIPFGLFAYGPALVLWVAVTGAAYVLSSRQPVRLALANPAAAHNAFSGQTGFVTSAVLLGGLLWVETSPVVGGAILGLMLLKPQFALLIPVALVAGAKWRALAAAAFSAVLLLAIGELAFGLRIYGAWWASLVQYSHAVADGFSPWNALSSPYGLLRFLAVPKAVALAGQLVITIAAAAIVAVSWRKEWRSKVAVFAAAAMLASPYSATYEAVVLIAPLGFLASRSPWKAVLLWVLMFIPLLGTTFFGHVPLPVNLIPNTIPIAAALALFFLWQDEQQDQSSLRMVSS